MATTTKVKWLGENIKDDADHRLITDEQIAKWNKIDEVDSEDFWIELTPENIGQYTCTMEDPDSFWTDMGMADGDGVIFDSSSLNPGNYIIKLGQDKLVKMNNNLRMPGYRKDGGIMLDFNDYSIMGSYGACYLDYDIEPNTLAFLCKFFGVKFDVSRLITALSNIGIRITLTTRRTYSPRDYGYDIFNRYSSGNDSGAPGLEEDENIIYLPKTMHNNECVICWPENIKIKIKRKEFGMPDNKRIGLVRHITADINIEDYYGCYNYIVVIEYDKYNPGSIIPFTPLDELYGIPTFSTLYVTNTIVTTTEDIEYGVHRTYYNYSSTTDQAQSHYTPMQCYDTHVYTDINNTTLIDGLGIFICDNSGYSDASLSPFVGKCSEIGPGYVYTVNGDFFTNYHTNNSGNNILVWDNVSYTMDTCSWLYHYIEKDGTTTTDIQLLSIRLNHSYIHEDGYGDMNECFNTCIYIRTKSPNEFQITRPDGSIITDNKKEIPLFIESEGYVFNSLQNTYDITIKSRGETYKYNNTDNCEIDLNRNITIRDPNTAIMSGTYQYFPIRTSELGDVLDPTYNLLHVVSTPCMNSGLGGYTSTVWRIVQKIYKWKSDTEFEEYIRYGCTDYYCACEDDCVTPLASEFKWTPWNKVVYSGDWALTKVGEV